MNTWIFAQNPFLHATDNNYSAAMKISTYHDSALSNKQSDPFFLELYNTYHPLHMAYQSAYDDLKSTGGIQQGDTLNLALLLKELAHTRIQQWDVAIQNHYVQNSPEYKKLLPHRRIPFQHGKYLLRVTAVKALSQTIDTDEALADLKTEIDNFYDQLDQAYTYQKGNNSSIKGKRNNLDSAWEAMCIGQYSDLASLMKKFATSPTMIEQYFDLQTIRNNPQVHFTGHLKAGEIHTIVKHTFDDTDQVILSNQGYPPLKFYLAPDKDLPPDAVFVTLNTGKQTVSSADLGKLSNKFLTVLNTDPLHPGEFAITLVR
jgi:hypothetical protein